MPHNIFGSSDEIKCEICHVSFLRKENYNLHVQSIKHKLATDPNYKSSEKTKREYEYDEWESKRPRLENELSSTMSNDSTQNDSNIDQSTLNRDKRIVKEFDLTNIINDSDPEDLEILEKIEQNFCYKTEMKEFQDKAEIEQERRKIQPPVETEIDNNNSQDSFYNTQQALDEVSKQEESNEEQAQAEISEVNDEVFEEREKVEEILSQKIKKSLSIPKF